MKTFTVVAFNPLDLTTFVFTTEAQAWQEAACEAWVKTCELNVVAVFEGEPARIDELPCVAENEDDLFASD